MGWFGKKPKKIKRAYKGRPSRKLDEVLRNAGFNPEVTDCETCKQPYNVNNQAALLLHKH